MVPPAPGDEKRLAGPEQRLLHGNTGLREAQAGVKPLGIDP